MGVCCGCGRRPEGDADGAKTEKTPADEQGDKEALLKEKKWSDKYKVEDESGGSDDDDNDDSDSEHRKRKKKKKKTGADDESTESESNSDSDSESDSSSDSDSSESGGDDDKKKLLDKKRRHKRRRRRRHRSSRSSRAKAEEHEVAVSLPSTIHEEPEETTAEAEKLVAEARAAEIMVEDASVIDGGNDKADAATGAEAAAATTEDVALITHSQSGDGAAYNMAAVDDAPLEAKQQEQDDDDDDDDDDAEEEQQRLQQQKEEEEAERKQREAEEAERKKKQEEEIKFFDDLSDDEDDDEQAMQTEQETKQLAVALGVADSESEISDISDDDFDNIDTSGVTGSADMSSVSALSDMESSDDDDDADVAVTEQAAESMTAAAAAPMVKQDLSVYITTAPLSLAPDVLRFVVLSSADSLEEMQAREHRAERERVEHEILASEQDMFYALQTVRRRFLGYLEDASNREWLGVRREDVDALFKDLMVMAAFSEEMYDRLHEDDPIAVYAELSSQLRIYKSYTAGIDKAWTALNRMSTNPLFTAFLEVTQAAVSGETIVDYLLMPVRHIKECEHLLLRLREAVPRTDYNWDILDKMTDLVTVIRNDVDLDVPYIDAMAELARLQLSMTDLSFPLMHPDRRLLRSGTLGVFDNNEQGLRCQFHLFSDMLVWSSLETNAFRDRLDFSTQKIVCRQSDEDAEAGAFEVMAVPDDGSSEAHEAYTGVRLNCASADEATSWKLAVESAVAAIQGPDPEHKELEEERAASSDAADAKPELPELVVVDRAELGDAWQSAWKQHTPRHQLQLEAFDASSVDETIASIMKMREARELREREISITSTDSR
eukprot:TRINITY_DN66122_c11_g1_i1.p1 TRINITY_DN66122_c11_g1~~TRINITY_DN66122_c11_g1_i1.p1  ORF type:complete len:850 (-),score=433.42 TRINITY_DN66122_c11_g1_i1:92-2596(-)